LRRKKEIAFSPPPPSERIIGCANSEIAPEWGAIFRLLLQFRRLTHTHTQNLLAPIFYNTLCNFYTQLGLDEDDYDPDEYLDDEDEDSEGYSEDDDEEDAEYPAEEAEEEEEEEEEEDEDDDDDDDDNDDNDEDEDEDEVGQLVPPFPPVPATGSRITCCPRRLLPPPATIMTSSSCKLDHHHHPRLPCGHIGVPTRDVSIQGKWIHTSRPEISSYFESLDLLSTSK
jgi:hypothetical protein